VSKQSKEIFILILMHKIFTQAQRNHFSRKILFKSCLKKYWDASDNQNTMFKKFLAMSPNFNNMVSQIEK